MSTVGSVGGQITPFPVSSEFTFFHVRTFLRLSRVCRPANRGVSVTRNSKPCLHCPVWWIPHNANWHRFCSLGSFFLHFSTIGSILSVYIREQWCIVITCACTPVADHVDRFKERFVPKGETYYVIWKLAFYLLFRKTKGNSNCLSDSKVFEFDY